MVWRNSCIEMREPAMSRVWPSNDQDMLVRGPSRFAMALPCCKHSIKYPIGEKLPRCRYFGRMSAHRRFPWSA
jgi:hypothetical protein